MGSVAGQHVQFLKGPLVDQVGNPLPRRQLALGLLALDGSR